MSLLSEECSSCWQELSFIWQYPQCSMWVIKRNGHFHIAHAFYPVNLIFQCTVWVIKPNLEDQLDSFTRKWSDVIVGPGSANRTCAKGGRNMVNVLFRWPSDSYGDCSRYLFVGTLLKTLVGYILVLVNTWICVAG